jgi:hypothetical protein
VPFDLVKQDDFVIGHGVRFIHYRAMPSPIGLKDRGEYRRSETLDTISENGFIYEKSGEFTGVIVNNSKNKTDVDGGIYQYSEARVTLPRFYNSDSELMAGERIHLCPGDRIFLKNVSKCEKNVVNYQRVQYNLNGDDFLQFQATRIEFLMDSLGRKYKENVHFKISNDGNIHWIDGKNTPGIDPETGQGRVYSIRYLYEAHWYIYSLPNELRIGTAIDNGIQKESRMPYQAIIQREYVYHNRQRGDSVNSNNKTITDRTNPGPIESTDPNRIQVKVDMNNIE